MITYVLVGKMISEAIGKMAKSEEMIQERKFKKLF